MGLMSAGAAIGWLAAQDPDRPAITHEDETWTRAELEARTNRLARAYVTLGVGEGSLVTIALPNGIEFYAACIASWKLGATPQPVSSRLPARERDAIIDLADPALVVGVAATDGPGLRPSVPRGFTPDASLADTPLTDVTPRHFLAPSSGGSTGRPKLIVSAALGEVDPSLDGPLGIAQSGTQVVPGPLYHNGPLNLSNQALLRGNHLVVMSRFDAAETLRLLALHRADWVLLAPTMMHRIWRLPIDERESYDLSALRVVMHFGAPCPVWLKQSWIDWVGPDRIVEMYAATEAQAGTIVTGREWLERPGTVGRPFAPGTITILDADGAELPAGEVGEVYLRRPAGTGASYHYVGAEARRHGEWESLGDMGWMDAEGYLYLTDRRTDMILVGGANVYPAEIESALEEHPAVRSSAVIGLHDDDLGQRVHAIVELDGEVSDDELRAHLSARLAPNKVPRSYERVDTPLRDDAGKVRRSALRAERV